MRLPTRRSEQLRQSKQIDDSYLTSNKIAELQRTRERLIQERPIAAAEVRRTQEMGDLSENAAYQEAKFRLRRINSRITVIEEKLKSAIAIPSAANSNGIIALGSQVTLENNGREQKFEILGASEADPRRGRISHLSPLGAALLGQRAGQSIKIGQGDRSQEYKIIRIE